MIIAKLFEFDAAHKLPNHSGKCKNLHGHTYKLEISVSGKINEKGMVIDFHDLDKIVRENVLDILDHSYLNDTIPNPTAENIVLWIWKKLENKIALNKIKLWETQDSCAVYEGD